ncbi:MAG: pyridoxamine 5'-phosphate oxidase [Candidatus Omnitrophica bacterium]|nr:pyridoxamine 5'-phosphate oxidase [Candidatus Omnitrophota bacterium]
MSTTRVPREALQAFSRVFRQARRCPAIRDATAMVLATGGRGGRPSVRAMLLKGLDARGFVFYTNLGSRKGRALAANPRAALTFLWHPIRQQVHVEGRVEHVSDGEADAYWATRPRDSQLGAWASRQSRPLGSRAALLARYRRVQRRFRGQPVPRPRAWTGFRVMPDRIEFWKEGSFRLHHRLLYERRGRRWIRRLLHP